MSEKREEYLTINEVDKIIKRETVVDVSQYIKNARKELHQAINRLEPLNDATTTLELESLKADLLIINLKFKDKYKQKIDTD